MDHPFVFRPGTWDERVFAAVALHNEYRLPDRLEPDDVIVDVGSHIGSFSYAAAQRGSHQIYGFEAFDENYARSVSNLASLSDRVTLDQRAVWRSDREVGKLYFTELPGGNNGAGHVLGSRGQEVEAVAFDAVIRTITHNGQRRVKLVKMDCEGSEYPILLTSRTLHLIDQIVGEYHNFTTEHDPSHPFHRISPEAEVPGYDRFTIDELAAALKREGFQVDERRHPIIPTLAGWFFARR